MKVLITGVTGQDGSILAKKLLQKGYEVHGTLRPASNPNFTNLQDIRDSIHYHYADLVDSNGIERVVSKVKPDQIYNFAAQSSVGIAQNTSDYTANVTGLGVLRLLDANSKLSTPAKFFQASSIEVEKPTNVYGASKLFAQNMVESYRNRFDTCVAVFSNHESGVRPPTFVTRKVIDSALKIFDGKQRTLEIGDTSVLRDWGWAPEYMEGAILLMEKSGSHTTTIATGVRLSLQQFIEHTFRCLGLNASEHVSSNANLSHSVNHTPDLRFSVDMTESLLGWRPKITGFQLVEEMLKAVNK